MWSDSNCVHDNTVDVILCLYVMIDLWRPTLRPKRSVVLTTMTNTYIDTSVQVLLMLYNDNNKSR